MFLSHERNDLCHLLYLHEKLTVDYKSNKLVVKENVNKTTIHIMTVYPRPKSIISLHLPAILKRSPLGQPEVTPVT